MGFKVTAIVLASMGLLFTMRAEASDGVAPMPPTGLHGGALSSDAAVAYLEALQFSLAIVGQPQLDQEQLAWVFSQLRSSYPHLPTEQRVELANARRTWTSVQARWRHLSAEQQASFVYEVLAFAFGEEPASEAVYGAPSASGGGGSYVHSSGDGTIASDGECTYASIPGMSISSCD